MSDPNQDFADAAVAAIQNQNQEEGAPPADAEGKKEPAEVDPLLEYAAALKEAGVPPEKARDFHQRFAYMQTPQGQQEWLSNYLRTDAGAGLRQQFGQEVIADMLARDPAKVFQMAQDLGYKPPSQAEPDDDVSPEQKEIRAMKAQQAALETRIKQLSDGAGSEIRALKTEISTQRETAAKLEAFGEWVRTQPPMAAKAAHTIANRASELSVIYPDKYSGVAGFKRAAADAHSEYASTAQFFQPKSRPRNGSGGGGGVAGGKVDDSKMTLAQRIDAAAEDFARASRGED